MGDSGGPSRRGIPMIEVSGPGVSDYYTKGVILDYAGVNCRNGGAEGHLTDLDPMPGVGDDSGNGQKVGHPSA